MTDAQKWLLLAAILLIGYLTYLLTPILLPFAFAAFLAYLGDPLADKLEILKIKTCQLGRTGAVVVVFLLMIVLISVILVILIPKIESQIAQFLAHVPQYMQWLNQTVIPWFISQSGIEIELVESHKIMAMLTEHWQKAGQSALKMLGSVTRSGAVLAEWLMNITLVPVVTFYLLRDWDVLVEKIYQLLPKRMVPAATKLAKETDAVLSAFMRGQLYVMFALGSIYSIGLWMIDLNLALLIGMVAGLISFVPYLGSIVGVAMAFVAAILQFQDVMYLIPVSIVFIAGQMLEGMVLTPLLVGDKVGLHPVAVIFAVLAGGQLFGFLGVLIALPLASVIMVFLRHIHEIYRDSEFYTS